MTKVCDFLTNNVASRTHNSKGTWSPITKKHEKLWLEDKIGKGTADKFCEGIDGNCYYLHKFPEKYGVESKCLGNIIG
jgi:hypothetical protein